MNRQELDILRDYLGAYLQQKGLSLRRSFRCLAPGHEDRNPSMSFFARANSVHCFGCGATYDIFDIVGLDYHLTTFGEQVDKVRELMGRSEDKPLQGTGSDGCSFLALGCLPDRTAELEAIQAFSEENARYFLDRGITNDSIAAYGLFQTKDRAYFPIIEQGVLTSWCGRAIADDIHPRYQNSTGRMGIWNSDRLQEAGHGRELFVTEGTIDAVVLEQLGFACVALCGAQNGRKFVQSVCVSKGWRYVLCGDADAAGRAMNESIAQGLQEKNIPYRILEPVDGDWNDMYLRDAKQLQAYLQPPDPEVLQQLEAGLEEELSALHTDSLLCTADVVDSFFWHVSMRGEAISTGLAELDQLLDGGLYEGLYVLGAISSLGKTSLALQMADFMAGSGQTVLFISLEQSRYELMAKSMSRLSAQWGGDKQAFTVRDLLRGADDLHPLREQLLHETQTAYRKLAQHLYIVEGMGDMGVPQIRKWVETCIQQTGRVPVMVVDYLQIIAPWDMRASDKQNTDRTVVELRRMSREYQMPILAVSSFNRDNYRTVVSMESFKESGAVEYSADVLLGIQLAGVGEKGFDVNTAKLKNPRQTELVLLKNRNGIPYGKIPLQYNAKFGLFSERKSAVDRFEALPYKSLY